MVCEECLGSGWITVVAIIPADDDVCSPRWDDLGDQPVWDQVTPPYRDLCTCILAPQFVNYIEVAA